MTSEDKYLHAMEIISCANFVELLLQNYYFAVLHYIVRVMFYNRIKSNKFCNIIYNLD